jgi:glutamate-1-semialdehyde 2,1-aminomutase
MLTFLKSTCQQFWSPFMATWKSSLALLEENSRYIPGGLASLNRRTDLPIAFARAVGSRMWDLDGHEYIDYHAGFAPYILGHNDPDVNRAVRDAIDAQLSNYGSGPTREEGELASLFLQCVEWAERVQFLNTGSEATAQAIRVARAATGRAHVLLVQGSYNGHHNTVAANLMSTRQQLGGKRVVGDEYPLVPITAGIPAEEQSLMHAVEFNDLAAVEAVARRYPLACMITEPVLQNVGVVEPAAGYLQGLRELADRYGFLLIFDEVKTGFRAALGGYAAICGIAPDLATYGKAFANGYPISALAGRRQYMDLVTSTDPSRRVLLAGTYNAHPVPVAAATACLRKLADPAADAYGRLERLAERLETGQRELFEKHGVTATIGRVGSAHCAYFMDRAPTCWWDILESHDAQLDATYRRALIERGIYNFPMPCKQGSISLAHSEQDIDQTLAAIDAALPDFAPAATA